MDDEFPEGYATCKRCARVRHERLEIIEYTQRRPLVLAQMEGHASHITVQVVDAGVFCSTSCLIAYLQKWPDALRAGEA